MIDFLTSGPALIALLTLTILGVLIGVDNIRFIEIATNKLGGQKKTNALNLSILLAFVLRFALLAIAFWILTLTAPFWDISISFFRGELSGRSLFLIIGGLFLLYKGATEIHEEVEDRGFDVRKITADQSTSFGKSIYQSMVINAVFAFDVILVAIGLTNELDKNILRVMVLAAIAVTLSLLILIVFKDALQRIFKKHPSIHILGLAFLILVGFAMIVEGSYLSHFHLFGTDAEFLPKNYINIAICTSLIFMFLAVKFRKENAKGEIID